MNANRRMSANDISNSSDLSNTFMVAMIREVPGMWISEYSPGS